MEHKTMRFTLTIPKDIAVRAAVLKKDIFFDKPYAEMYRQLILLGIEKLQESADEMTASHNVHCGEVI